MGIKEIFKKQGGMTLLKRYWSSGVLPTACGQFLLLGKSRTALEILRLSTQLKVKQKIEKKYKNKLYELMDAFDGTLPHIHNNKVWVCWLQGIECAPWVVQKCYQSITDNLKDKEVILITETNYRQYIQFPEYIQKKIDAGIISGAHMTDLLRLELLITYGGTWIDATVFCSSNTIPNYMLDSDLFMFQCLKPGRDGHSFVISNWFISATTNNKLLCLTKGLLYEYWKENDKLMDYFIFHIFFQMVLDSNEEEWKKVVPFDNAVPHVLLLRLFQEYDEEIWKAIKEMTPFHKLTYKFDADSELKSNTYYAHLIANKFTNANFGSEI